MQNRAFRRYLRDNGACNELLAWIKTRNAETAWAQCHNADWMIWLATRLGLWTGPALAEYEKVRGAALAEYQKVSGAALAEYQKVSGAAWAEYQKVSGAAVAEYEKVSGPAVRSIVPWSALSAALVATVAKVG